MACRGGLCGAGGRRRSRAGAPRPRRPAPPAIAQQAQSQPHTAMGIGIELPPNQEAARSAPQADAGSERIPLRQSSARTGVSTYTVSDGSGALTLPIRYAFGVHNLTFVLEYQGRFYESLVSYYEDDPGTGDHHRRRPHPAPEPDRSHGPARRRTRRSSACFNCHGTDGVSQGKLTLDSLQAGRELRALPHGRRCAHASAGRG